MKSEWIKLLVNTFSVACMPHVTYRVFDCLKIGGPHLTNDFDFPTEQCHAQVRVLPHFLTNTCPLSIPNFMEHLFFDFNAFKPDLTVGLSICQPYSTIFDPRGNQVHLVLLNA